jgi:hypothetical protein
MSKEVNKHDLSKQPVISFTDPMTDIKGVEIDCTVENLLDGMWLFEHTPWLNHDGKMAIYRLDKTSTIYFYNDTYKEIQTVEFDVAEVSAMHGFAGNSYVFTFKLGGEDKVQLSSGPMLMAITEDEIKEKVEKYLNHLIEQTNKKGKDLVDTYNKVLLPKVKRRFS